MTSSTSHTFNSLKALLMAFRNEHTPTVKIQFGDMLLLSSCCLSIVNWMVFLNDCLHDENFIKHRSDWHVVCDGLDAGWNDNHCQ